MAHGRVGMWSRAMWRGRPSHQSGRASADTASSTTSRIGDQTTAGHGGRRPCIPDTATELSPAAWIIGQRAAQVTRYRPSVHRASSTRSPLRALATTELKNAKMSSVRVSKTWLRSSGNIIQGCLLRLSGRTVRGAVQRRIAAVSGVRQDPNCPAWHSRRQQAAIGGADDGEGAPSGRRAEASTRACGPAAGHRTILSGGANRCRRVA